MEKRKSERVQFFQVDAGKDIQPVWVFHQTHPGSKLGLLIDIGENGAQVLTGKSEELAGETFLLIVHSGEVSCEDLLKVTVRCRWSQQDGGLYVRNGLTFEERASVQAVLKKWDAGTRWLRCELL
jgi:hypothetical protein